MKEEKPEPLTEKQLNEVPIAVEVFSMEVVGLGAKHAYINYLYSVRYLHVVIVKLCCHVWWHFDVPEKCPQHTQCTVCTCMSIYTYFCIMHELVQVEYVYAKQYQLREKGLRQIHDMLSDSEVHSRKELSTMVKATMQILKRGLSDQVFSVSLLFCKSIAFFYFCSPSSPCTCLLPLSFTLVPFFLFLPSPFLFLPPPPTCSLSSPPPYL